MTSNFNFWQLVVTMVAGLVGSAFGAGVVWGTLKSRLKQYDEKFQKDDLRLAEIERRQKLLRGETNGSESIYMPRISCFGLRQQCQTEGSRSFTCINEDISELKLLVMGLSNFARWSMQKNDNMDIIAIDKILHPDR